MLTETTAELAAALTLSAARRVPEADVFMRAGKYEGWLPTLFVGKLLQNKTVGIVGAGRIGSAYARMMVEGHKMNLIYYDPYPNKFLEEYIRCVAGVCICICTCMCTAGVQRGVHWGACTTSWHGECAFAQVSTRLAPPRTLPPQQVRRAAAPHRRGARRRAALRDGGGGPAGGGREFLRPGMRGWGVGAGICSCHGFCVDVQVGIRAC